MKTYLRDKHKLKNLEQLKEGIRKYWKKVTPEVCTRYIDHIQKVMPVVVVKKEPLQGIKQFNVLLWCVFACL